MLKTELKPMVDSQLRTRPERVYDAIDSGVLAMDAYVFN